MDTIEPTLATIDREKLRRFRGEAFLSQRELAAKAGLSPATIVNLESRDGITAHGKTVRKLAAALGVDPHELVRR